MSKIVVPLRVRECPGNGLDIDGYRRDIQFNKWHFGWLADGLLTNDNVNSLPFLNQAVASDNIPICAYVHTTGVPFTSILKALDFVVLLDIMNFV